MRLLFFWLLTSLSTISLAHEKPTDFYDNTSQLKVLIFLSKDCPCSQSHVEHLNQLTQDFKNVAFYGVIADSLHGSEKGEVEKYFQSKNFSFPIIADPEQVLVKQFKALKTPHVVLLKKQPNREYTTLYEGGVSDHRNGKNAKIYFLKENLLALSKNQSLPYTQGKSLGCYIRRI